MSDCYDGCSTGDCDVCGLYVDAIPGWRGVWMRFRARVIRRFTHRWAPVEPASDARPCTATMADAENAPDATYRCNRTAPHRLLHSETAPDGTALAWWCSCEECRTSGGGAGAAPGTGGER